MNNSYPILLNVSFVWNKSRSFPISCYTFNLAVSNHDRWFCGFAKWLFFKMAHDIYFLKHLRCHDWGQQTKCQLSNQEKMIFLTTIANGWNRYFMWLVNKQKKNSHNHQTFPSIVANVCVSFFVLDLHQTSVIQMKQLSNCFMTNNKKMTIKPIKVAVCVFCVFDSPVMIWWRDWFI